MRCLLLVVWSDDVWSAAVSMNCSQIGEARDQRRGGKGRGKGGDELWLEASDAVMRD